MPMFSTVRRFGAVTQAFHWLTVILVLAAYLTSVGGPPSRIYSPAMDFSRSLHETLGLAVFVVAILRIIWRTFDGSPQDPPAPFWMEAGARIVRSLLYILLLAVPLTAIIGSWLQGHPLTPLGFASIEPWLAPAGSLGGIIVDIHTTLGNVILWVAGLHAAAALYHHFVLRDRVLRQMLPGAET